MCEREDRFNSFNFNNPVRTAGIAGRVVQDYDTSAVADGSAWVSDFFSLPFILQVLLGRRSDSATGLLALLCRFAEDRL